MTRFKKSFVPRLARRQRRRWGSTLPASRCTFCRVLGTDFVVTGSAKSERLLWLAASYDCLIAIDALDELYWMLTLVPYRERGHILLARAPIGKSRQQIWL